MARITQKVAPNTYASTNVNNKEFWLVVVLMNVWAVLKVLLAGFFKLMVMVIKIPLEIVVSLAKSSSRSRGKGIRRH